MSDEAKNVLRSLAIFERLGDDALEAVASRTVTRKYAKGTVIFREGEEARGLFVVMQGSVKICRSSSDGREQVLLVEHAGRSLAELPLFDGSPYPATARAAEASQLLFLPRDSFDWLLHNNPEIANATLREYGKRIRKLVHLVDKLALKEVPARVATALLEQAELTGAAKDGGVFTLSSTHEEMAEQLGTTRESVSRAMSALRKRGAIRQHGPKVTILDAAALRAASGIPTAFAAASVFDHRA